MRYSNALDGGLEVSKNAMCFTCKTIFPAVRLQLAADTHAAGAAGAEPLSCTRCVAARAFASGLVDGEDILLGGDAADTPCGSRTTNE